MATDGMHLIEDLARHPGVARDAASALVNNLGGVRTAALAAIDAFGGFKALEGIPTWCATST